MRSRCRFVGCVIAVALLAATSLPSAATTMVRQGLERLTANSAMVITGRVEAMNSHWNEDHSSIVTDVRVRITEHLKGPRTSGEVLVTLEGGAVDDIALDVGGSAQVVPGADYVWFLNHEEGPGRAPMLTTTSLSQGVFDIVPRVGKQLAVSQAALEPLVGDEEGLTRAPGGEAGLDLDELLRQVRHIVKER